MARSIDLDRYRYRDKAGYQGYDGKIHGGIQVEYRRNTPKIHARGGLRLGLGRQCVGRGGERGWRGLLGRAVGNALALALDHVLLLGSCHCTELSADIYSIQQSS